MNICISESAEMLYKIVSGEMKLTQSQQIIMWTKANTWLPQGNSLTRAHVNIPLTTVQNESKYFFSD